jgi:cytochrome c peroxidase
VKDSENINPLMHHVMDGGVQLTDIEKAQLKAFLNTLTDETFLNNPDYSKP